MNTFFILQTSPTYGPQWLANLSWLFWFGASLLTLVAFYLLRRSLLRDPDRKKRRCPKCWYDMTRVNGLRCPECGRKHASEKKLHTRRRRVLIAGAGSVALLIAITCSLTPRVMQRGWLGSVPRLAIVVAARVYDTEDRSIARYAIDRLASGSITRAEWHFLEGCVWDLYIHHSPELQTSGSFCYSPSYWTEEGLARTILDQLEASGHDTVPLIASLMSSTRATVRRSVLRGISNYNDQRIRDVLTRSLGSTDEEEFRIAASNLNMDNLTREHELLVVQAVHRFPISTRELSRFGTPGEDRLADFLSDPAMTADAAKGLLSCGVLSEQNYQKLLNATENCPIATGREWCVAVLSPRGRDDPNAQRILSRLAIDDPNEAVRSTAIDHFARTTSNAPLLVSTLIIGLKDAAPNIRYASARYLADTAPDGFAAIPALESLANDPTQEKRARQAATESLGVLTTAKQTPSAILPPSSDPPVPLPCDP